MRARLAHTVIDQEARLVEEACVALAVEGPIWLTGRSALRLRARPELCVALLQRSEELSHCDPVQMVYFAFLAELAARGLEPRRWGAVRVADLQAAALTELGNAYRVTGEFARAREAFARAHERLEAGSREPKLTARLLSLAASLLAVEGRLEQEPPLLARARLLCTQLDDDVESARAAIEKGMYAGHAGQVDEAGRLEEFAHKQKLLLAGFYDLVSFLRQAAIAGRLRSRASSSGGTMPSSRSMPGGRSSRNTAAYRAGSTPRSGRSSGRHRT
jgi:tetratricopeptide (TPR) repeat protein